MQIPILEQECNLRPYEVCLIFLLKKENNFEAVKGWILEYFVGENAPARLNIQNRADSNKSFLHYALDNFHLETVNFLMQYLPLDVYDLVDSDGKTPLIIALERQLDIATELFEMSPGLFHKAKDKPMLAYAAQVGNVEIFNKLIRLFHYTAARKQYFSSSHVFDADGNSLLYYAIKHGQKDIMKLLIARSLVSPNIKNNADEAVLVTAGKLNEIEVCDYLIKSGARVNDVDAEGDTPLHHACRSSNDALVALLLSRKANCFVKNKAGETPLAISIQIKDLRTISLLLDYGAAIGQKIPENLFTLLAPLNNRSYVMLATVSYRNFFPNAIRTREALTLQTFSQSQIESFTLGCITQLIENKDLYSWQKNVIEEYLSGHSKKHSLTVLLIHKLSDPEFCKKIPGLINQYNMLPNEIAILLPVVKKMVNMQLLRNTVNDNYRDVQQANPEIYLEVIDEGPQSVELEHIEKPRPSLLISEKNPAIYEIDKRTNLERRDQYLININDMLAQLIQFNNQLGRYKASRISWKMGYIIAQLLLFSVLLFTSFLIRGVFKTNELDKQTDLLTFVFDCMRQQLYVTAEKQFNKTYLWFKTLKTLFFGFDQCLRSFYSTEDKNSCDYIGSISDCHTFTDTHASEDHPSTDSHKYCDHHTVWNECPNQEDVIFNFLNFIAKNYTTIMVALVAVLLLCAYLSFANISKFFGCIKFYRKDQTDLDVSALTEDEKISITNLKSHFNKVVSNASDLPENRIDIPSWHCLLETFNNVKTIKEEIAAIDMAVALFQKETSSVKEHALKGTVFKHYESPYLFLRQKPQQLTDVDLERNMFLLKEYSLDRNGGT